MVKYYILLIILLSISYVQSQESKKCEEVVASTVDECRDKISQEYKNSGYHCCLQKGTKDGVQKSICRYLTEEDYADIKDYIGDIKDGGYTDVSVDCKSYYLQLGILSLFLFLL